MSILEEKKEQDAKKRIRQAIGSMPYGGTIGLIPMTEDFGLGDIALNLERLKNGLEIISRSEEERFQELTEYREIFAGLRRAVKKLNLKGL